MMELRDRTLKALSLLLSYPTRELQSAMPEIGGVLASETRLTAAARRDLRPLVEELTTRDIYDIEEQYVMLFDRSRTLSLNLFEHVHGESRDRGQAMVDLIEQYKQAGLELSQNELPDYIPLFLEFLSTQGEDNAKQWLSEVEHILALLQCRLEKRESDYAVVFSALLEIAESQVDLAALRTQINGEKRDDTKQAIDKEWEEEAVTFGAPDANSCPSSVNRPSETQRKDQYVPVTWTDFNQQAS
mgnify:CR=1 FL=1